LLGVQPLVGQGLTSLQQFPFDVRFRPDQARLARRVFAIAAGMDSLPGIADRLWREDEITIVLAPTERDFQQSAGGHVPEWGAGVAIPQRSRIVLPAWGSLERGGPLDYATVLRHELAHIALYRAVAPASIPRWFAEGYASWVAGQLDASRAWRLRIAFVTGRAPPLDSLAIEWPRTAAPAELAYILSASVIEYLVDESGTYGLQRLFERWRAGGDFEKALIATYGVNTGSLESQWRRYVKRKYGWTVVLTQSALFGVIAGTIVFVFFMLRRRRDRLKLAQLQANEPPDSPAYWSEGSIEIIAHRGYSARAPENTMAAMELALARGATALEFDVHASLDGVPVVIHDDSVERTTNGAGKVRQLTMAQLHKLDAGGWFGPAFRGEAVPTLEQLLQSVRTRAQRLYIELKQHAFRPSELDTVVDLVERFDFADRCVIMSFDWRLLDYIATRSAFIIIAYLADDETTFLRAIERARADGRALVDCNYQILLRNPELARRAHEAGVELAVYTVNERVAASQLVEQGVRRLTTNEVELLIRWAQGR
jgi:glycerophosphoryl diester phosphodiesterase